VAAAIVAGILGAVAVVVGVYLAESLHRRAERAEREHQLILSILNNSSRVIVALPAQRKLSGPDEEAYEQVAQDLNELLLLCRLRRDRLHSDVLVPLEKCCIRWAAVRRLLAAGKPITREDGDYLSGQMQFLELLFWGRKPSDNWVRGREQSIQALVERGLRAELRGPGETLAQPGVGRPRSGQASG
jgi:hypothetical protein